MTEHSIDLESPIHLVPGNHDIGTPEETTLPDVPKG